MSTTPTQAEANAAAIATMTALVTAANTAWINNANTIINNLINVQGKFSVGLTITPHVSIHDIVVYFSNLGYQVYVPPQQHEFSAYYFGGGWTNFSTNVYFCGNNWWNAYWNERNFCNCKNPCRVIISWQQGFPQF